MRQFSAKRNYLLLHDNGTIHYPFSKFLTDEFDNPNTRELVSQSLRILQRFFVAHGIELTVRMLEERCLTYDEIKSLAGLCYRPLGEIERLSMHIPVENEHLFRFKMNADSGLRVHRFRTPQCTYSDVR